jgi:hypothetical protein
MAERKSRRRQNTVMQILSKTNLTKTGWVNSGAPGLTVSVAQVLLVTTKE